MTLTNHDFSGTVTLAGGGKASFTASPGQRRDLTLDGLAFDYVPGEPVDKPFTVDGSRNVAIRDADFDGHLSGGYGEGIGLRVRTSAGSPSRIRLSTGSCAAPAFTTSLVSSCAATTCR